MHDAIIAERMGIASVAIITAKFVTAAEMMARALGAEGYRFVTIDHPISSATAQALSSRARDAVAECMKLLVEAPAE